MRTDPDAGTSQAGARVAERGAALAVEAIRVVREVLARHDGRPYALLDFPCFPNVGDNAIWLGTRAALAAIGLPPPAYTCDNRTFEPDVLARLVGDGPILLLGGGNFGDLFPKHQRLRERVVATFPSNPVVQLPQTIRFREPEALEAARRAFASHRDLKVLVRDAESLDVATRVLHLDAALCPDLAFALEPARARARPPRRVLWLSRYDSWRLHVPPPPAEDLVVADWRRERPSFRRAVLRFLSSRIRRGRARGTRERSALSALYDPLARWRVARGLDRLAEGAVVITDRLHGHVLSMRSGTPHVLLDDRTGKVRAFHETWTRGLRGVAWADDRAEALARAREMLARGSPSDAPRA